MAVISVDLRRNNKYNGVHLYYYENNIEAEKVFMTGDFVKDWYQAKRFYITEIQEMDDNESNLVLSQSESVDQFLFDMPKKKYTSAFMKITEDGTQVSLLYPKDFKSYSDRSDIMRRGWEMFVPVKSKWTWEEYKSYCTAE